MKKIILIIILGFIFNRTIISQLNIQQIYFTDSVIINNVQIINSNFTLKKNFYIQLWGESNNPPYYNEPRTGKWYRYHYNSNSFSNSFHNNLFSNSYTSCSPWPWFAYTYTKFYEISHLDTNFIFYYITGSDCNDVFDNIRISYNNGLGYSATPFNSSSSGSGFRGLDIDPNNDAIMYIGYDNTNNSGNIYKSTNRGYNWFVIDSIPYLGTLLKIDPLKTSNIFITGINGIYRSTNSGYLFNSVNIAQVPINSIHFDMVDSSVYATSSNNNGGIFKSTNHGSSFIKVLDKLCRAMEIDPDNHNRILAGADNSIYQSTNGGNTWNLYHNGIYPQKTIVGIIKNISTDTFFVATLKGVYKIWGPFVGIKKISSDIPKTFALHQNYPNPFNPSTNIKYEIPKSGFVKLTIYDVLGKEIEKLVHENQTAGT
jgi:hypothetical protein